jgi:hypothetical protein
MKEEKFCASVLTEWTSQFGPVFNATSGEPRTCILEIDEAKVTFFYDYRDGRISSSILFTNDEVAKTDELDTSTLYKLIKLKAGETTEEASWGSDSVKAEVERVLSILSDVREGKYGARDLSYFFWGFNAAYSESLNRRAHQK